MSICRRSDETPDKGFVLVIVIWFVGLLALIAATFAHTARTHIRISANALESTRAELLTDAGVMLAVRDLVLSAQSIGQPRRFAITSQPVSCLVEPEGRLLIDVRDAAGKVNINKAGLPLIETLLMGMGETPATASTIAASLLDFRDHDDKRRLNGAELSDYLTAGRERMPKNAPFEVIDEVTHVFGISPSLAEKLKPHITLHSNHAGIDPRVASDELIAILKRGLEGATASFATFAATSRTGPLPSLFTSISQRRIFHITVRARTTSQATFVRAATVDLGSRSASTFVFLTWQRGDATGATVDRSAAGVSIPPC